MKTLNDWYAFFEKRYNIVGYFTSMYIKEQYTAFKKHKEKGREEGCIFTK